MRTDITALATLAAAGVASAHPHLASRQSGNSSGENPFEGRQLFVNPDYSDSLEVTRESFQGNDTENAGKVQFIQEQVGSFVWISNIAALDDIDTAIEAATAAQDSGDEQVVGLVLYNLPDRDCSAGESSGELTVADGGLERYKTEYVDVFAEKVLGAKDLQFAIVVEPDAVANMVTGGDIELCSNAAEPQRDGMAYAIDQLQAENVHVYLDAANGGWLGDEESVTATASEFADIVGRTNGSGVRGFSTNVSNYNAFAAESPEPITDGSQSYDESHFVSNLAPAFEAEGLPSRFIVDQGRVALPGARNDWGDWCNVEAGFGQPPTTETDNEYVDSIVWVKPGGESDGECGMSGAPEAGSWFNAAAQFFTEHAHPDIKPVSS